MMSPPAYEQCKEYSVALTDSLWHQRERGKFCDLNITVGGDTTPVHSCVLAAASQFFATLIENKFENRSFFGDTIDIDLTSHFSDKNVAFEPLIKYVYTGKVDVSAENFVSLLHCSKELNLDILANSLVLYVPDILNVDNAITIYSQSKLLGYEDVRRECSDFICDSLSLIIAKAKDLSIQVFLQLLSVKLHRFNNKMKIKLIFDWISHDHSAREPELTHLMSSITKTIPFANNKPNQTLTKHVDYLITRHQLFTDCEKCTQTVFEHFSLQEYQDEIIRAEVTDLLEETVELLDAFEKDENMTNMSSDSQLAHSSLTNGPDSIIQAVDAVAAKASKDVLRASLDLDYEEDSDDTDDDQPTTSHSNRLVPSSSTSIFPMKLRVKQRSLQPRACHTTPKIIDYDSDEYFPSEDERLDAYIEGGEEVDLLNLKKEVGGEGAISLSTARELSAMLKGDLKKKRSKRKQSNPLKAARIIKKVKLLKVKKEQRIKPPREKKEKVPRVKKEKVIKPPRIRRVVPEPRPRVSCSMCQFTCSSSLRLLSHVATSHSAVIEYVCTACDAVETTEGLYNIHLKTHYGDPPYVCDQCQKPLDSPQKYLNHKLRVHKHQGLIHRPYRCSICQKRFVTRDGCVMHYLAQHQAVATGGENPRKSYPCSTCDKVLHSLHAMEEHMTAYHCQAHPHMCETCGLQFKYRSQIVHHRKIHTGNVYRCQVAECKYSTPRRQAINEHMRSHANQREFVCDRCGKAFILKSHMKRHKRLHDACDGKFTHFCNYPECTFGTYRGDKLKEHYQRKHVVNSTISSAVAAVDGGPGATAAGVSEGVGVIIPTPKARRQSTNPRPRIIKVKKEVVDSLVPTSSGGGAQPKKALPGAPFGAVSQTLLYNAAAAVGMPPTSVGSVFDATIGAATSASGDTTPDLNAVSRVLLPPPPSTTDVARFTDNSSVSNSASEQLVNRHNSLLSEAGAGRGSGLPHDLSAFGPPPIHPHLGGYAAAAIFTSQPPPPPAHAAITSPLAQQQQQQQLRQQQHQQQHVAATSGAAGPPVADDGEIINSGDRILFNFLSNSGASPVAVSNAALLRHQHAGVAAAAGAASHAAVAAMDEQQRNKLNLAAAAAATSHHQPLPLFANQAALTSHLQQHAFMQPLVAAAGLPTNNCSSAASPHSQLQQQQHAAAAAAAVAAHHQRQSAQNQQQQAAGAGGRTGAGSDQSGGGGRNDQATTPATIMIQPVVYPGNIAHWPTQ